MNNKKSLRIVLEIVLLSFIISFYAYHVQLLPDQSRYYSTSLPHRLQTNALLEGKLSLSPRPFGIPCDYIWAGEHGMQQAWGLGVPLLRLPFEWVSHLAGFGPFPDRVTALFYIIVMVFCLNIAFRSLLTGVGIAPLSTIGMLIRLYLISWILYSPPMSSLIQNGLNVYKETIFYGCVDVYILLALFVIYCQKPSAKIFILLSFMSGCAWLIRPTVLVYGIVTFGIATGYLFQQRRHWKLMALGLFSFGWGILIELLLNYFRFGSMLEFGYSGIVGGFAFVEKFGGPYQHEPFLNAFKEFLSDIFINNHWVSQTFRYRENDIYTFNISHLIMVGVGYISLLIIWIRSFKGREFPLSRLPAFKSIYALLCWGGMCFGVLFVFYMHYVLYSARYIAEFSMSINAMLIALFFLGCLYINSHNNWIHRRRLLGLYIVSTSVLFYLNDNLFFVNKTDYSQATTDKAGIQRIIHSFNLENSMNYDFPNTFFCGHHYELPGASFQFSGWNIDSNCSVADISLLFLPLKKCLYINYSLDQPKPIPPVAVRRDFNLLKLKMTQMHQGKNGSVEVTQQFCLADDLISNAPAFYAIRWVLPDDVNYDRLPIYLNWVSVIELPAESHRS